MSDDGKRITATAAEEREPRAGDDLVAPADVVMDRAFTVAGSTETVWPWIVQLGKRRAGWYLPGSVERLLPRGRRAARTIERRWQQLDVADVIPDYGGRNETFTVAEIHPPTTLVYRSRRRSTELTARPSITIAAPNRGARSRRWDKGAKSLVDAQVLTEPLRRQPTNTSEKATMCRAAQERSIEQSARSHGERHRMPNFESFNRRMLPLKVEPFVTIQKRGTISLNRSAFAALGAPDAVELLYDRQRGIVGLRPIDPRAENAYQVRRTSSSASGPWVISAMAFTKFYDIDTSCSRRWVAFLDDGVLCADLSADGTQVSSNRAAKPR